MHAGMSFGITTSRQFLEQLVHESQKELNTQLVLSAKIDSSRNFLLASSRLDLATTRRFRHRARSWSHQRRICYKAEHTATGQRFLITNCSGPAATVFAFYNDRGECENRIEEFKNGFRADRLSCHSFLANAFRLLLHGFAYNVVDLFRLHLPQPWRSAQIETLRALLFKLGARVRQTARCIRIHLATSWPFQSLFRDRAGF